MTDESGTPRARPARPTGPPSAAVPHRRSTPAARRRAAPPAIDAPGDTPVDAPVDARFEGPVEDDPDSTAEGIPRPSLDGVPDDTPTNGDAARSPWSVDDDGEVTGRYEVPEIVPATADPEPQVEQQSEQRSEQRSERAPRPTPAVRTEPASPAPVQPEPSWRAYVPAVTTATVSPPPVDLRAPGRRPRVRRVTRVVRHVDPWSVFKIGLIFSLVAYVSLLTSGVLLWRVADATGTIDNVERWFLQFGWETFEFKGGEIFHNAWIIGLFGVVAMTGALVLLATLFNLVSDIVGGIRVTVLEEEVVERTLSSSRRFVVRRPPNVPPSNGTVGADWSVDDEPPGTAPATATPATTAPATAPIPATVPGDWSVDD